jgi:hypothetical protein
VVRISNPPGVDPGIPTQNCTDLHEGPSPLAQGFPAEWMFWRERTQMTRETQYPGGALDALSLNSTPFYDACTHDPMITMMGALPASFPALLQGIGHPTSSAGPNHQNRPLLSTNTPQGHLGHLPLPLR